MSVSPKFNFFEPQGRDAPLGCTLGEDAPFLPPSWQQVHPFRNVNLTCSCLDNFVLIYDEKCDSARYSMCIMDNPNLIVKFNNFGPTLFKLGMVVVNKGFN